MQERLTLSVERTFPAGYYRVSAIVNDRYVSNLYIGYTKRESIQLFREFIKSTTARRYFDTYTTPIITRRIGVEA